MLLANIVQVNQIEQIVLILLFKTKALFNIVFSNTMVKIKPSSYRFSGHFLDHIEQILVQVFIRYEFHAYLLFN